MDKLTIEDFNNMALGENPMCNHKWRFTRHDGNRKTVNFVSVLEQLAEVMRENERLKSGLHCVDGACMWAFDLGSSIHYPESYTDINRARGYAHHLNQARYYALKALFPERAEKGDFENLLNTMRFIRS